MTSFKGALAMATRNALSLAVHTCIKTFFEKKNIYCFSVGAWLGFDSITFASAPCQYNLSFSFSNLAYSRKTQHESSKIFFEHSSHVAKPIIFFRTAQRALLWTAVCQ